MRPEDKRNGYGKQRRRGAPGASRAPALGLLVLSSVLLLCTGCGSPPGLIFDPADSIYRWPVPPDQPRIAYIGQIRSDIDLKPGRAGLQGVGETLFGKEPP